MNLHDVYYMVYYSYHNNISFFTRAAEFCLPPVWCLFHVLAFTFMTCINISIRGWESCSIPQVGDHWSFKAHISLHEVLQVSVLSVTMANNVLYTCSPVNKFNLCLCMYALGLCNNGKKLIYLTIQNHYLYHDKY